MKFRIGKVVTLWVTVMFVMWFVWSAITPPQHFMAFLFTSTLVVVAFIPALWETLLLALTFADRDRTYDLEWQIERLVKSGANYGTVRLDVETVFELRWEPMRETWHVELLAAENDRWHSLSWDRFFALEDAVDWMRHNSQLSY